MKKIDIHMHTGYVHNTYCSPQLIADIIQEENILGFSSSLSGYNLGQQFANDETANLVSLAKGHIKGLVYFCPYDPQCIIDTIKRIKQGFVGIKLHPYGNIYDVTLEFLSPVFKLAGELDVPIVTHTDYVSVGQHNLTNANLYEPLMKEFPHTKLVLYHFRPPEEAIFLASNYKNVYLEVSSHKQETIMRAVETVGCEKLLFGTDAPFGIDRFITRRNYGGKSYHQKISEIDSFPLTDYQKECIFYKNTESLFKL